jgi:2,4-dienoyl-CoA reductase-like NADH-dependent reductase (Old Yellow Enzyme family)
MTNKLFSPLKLREVTFRNRIFVSPMCQYSAIDGIPNDWHMVHLGSRAIGGAGLIIAEATAVCPEGRISPDDLGLWNDQQLIAFEKIAAFINSQGSVPGIQLAHAGRKASMSSSWKGGKLAQPGENGWEVVAPSAIPFSGEYGMPHALTLKEIDEVVRQFADATHRAVKAGFQVIELHMAHGYLIHQFLSPLTNHREDEYGGSLENRMKLPLRVAREVRNALPATLPLFVRISVTDWAEGGWDLKQSVQLCKELKAIGVDLIDCSSGGLVSNAKIPVGPGYQVPFAAAIKSQADILTGAVGLITKAIQAEEILQNEEADVIILGREMLRDPYWPLHAAREFDIDLTWPKQYLRAK